jgi:hypothetical protein
MRYSQQTVLAVAVLASSALAAPIDTRDARNGRKTGALDAAGSFTNALDGVVGTVEQVKASLEARDDEEFWSEITSRSVEEDDDEDDNLERRDIFDEINNEYDRTIGARDIFDEVVSEYDRTIGARDIFDEVVSEYDRTIGARDIFDEINEEYDHTIGAREAEPATTDSEFWDEVGTFARR